MASHPAARGGSEQRRELTGRGRDRRRYRRDFYSMVDQKGQLDDTVEDLLAELEDKAAKVIRKVINGAWPCRSTSGRSSPSGSRHNMRGSLLPVPDTGRSPIILARS
ncbi:MULTISPECIES: DUF4238 domain-containing protein [Streptomyces albogriseolus group]|uniref:DUF4238 domain-containing protein n=1 Tax=Streptomyces albogriseolus group TaxID=2867120 RepID=UPI00347BDFFA